MNWKYIAGGLAGLFILVQSLEFINKNSSPAPSSGVQPVQQRPASNTFDGLFSAVRPLADEYANIQRLRQDTREKKDRSEKFMQDYGRLREQILSLPINGCVTGLRVERGALQGFIWEHNFNKNSIWLSAAAPANSIEIFRDDRTCLEARVTDFACVSKIGVANPGSLPGTIYPLIFLRRLVAPIDADAARSAFPIQSVTYGLDLTCSINVEASSVSVRR